MYLTFSRWIQEPDDRKHLQNCVALTMQGSVSDEQCTDFHRYICEYTNTAGNVGIIGAFFISVSSVYVYIE